MRFGKTTMSRSGRTGSKRVMPAIWAWGQCSATKREALFGEIGHDQQRRPEIVERMYRCRDGKRQLERALTPDDVKSGEDQEGPPDHQAPSGRLERMDNPPSRRA